MKLALGILVAVVLALGILWWSSKETARKQMSEAREQLTTVSNEVTQVRSEMQTRAAELQQTVTTLTAEKSAIEQQVGSLTNQLSEAQAKLEQEHQKVGSLESETERLTGEIQAVTNQLTGVEQKLTTLQETHATTVEHMQAMREDFTVLSREKKNLDEKFHDLGALKTQIRNVKQDVHAQRIAERRRSDRAESVEGNAGYLMKAGQWMAVAETNAAPTQFPLIQEIHAPND